MTTNNVWEVQQLQITTANLQKFIAEKQKNLTKKYINLIYISIYYINMYQCIIHYTQHFYNIKLIENLKMEANNDDVNVYGLYSMN